MFYLSYTLNGYITIRGAIVSLKYHFSVDSINNPIPFSTVDLFQIGIAHCGSNTLIGDHIHTDFYELSLITSGKGSITTNNIKSDVEKDDIYLSLPSEKHSLSSDTNSIMNYYFIAFSVKDPELNKQIKKISSFIKDENKRVFRNDTLRQLVAEATTEMNTFNIYKKVYLSNLFTLIIIQILRSIVKSDNKKRSVTTKNELCFQIMSYITTNIYTINALTEVADALNYDYSYLSKLFVATTSQTISDYYRKQRLNTACTLIRNENMSFTQIAEKLHYSSIYAFSKSFKQQFNVSPRDYKKALSNPPIAN